MGLACSQARFLTLTARKADTELAISITSMHKMALTREMSQLSQEYYGKLQSKNIAYYADGKYNKINYNYLMGYGRNLTAAMHPEDFHIKSQNDMILTDFKGQVVLSQDYANAIMNVLGPSAMDANGRGGTFSTSDIPAILEKLTYIPKEQFQEAIEGGALKYTFTGYGVNTLSGEETGNSGEYETDWTDEVQAVLNLYYPIFAAAATNGWTTEYNQQMNENPDYLSDALVTGSFQLVTVGEVGEYDEGCSLTFFITRGLIDARTDSDVREEVTAQYNAEKERISEKETLLDLQLDDLSTELEAIKTEMQSIQSLIDDAVQSVFNWGNS